MYKSVLILTAILFVSACSTSTKIKYLEPAKVKGISKLKRISVDNFKNDSLGLSGKIETRISQKSFNNKPYFTLVNRSHIKDILLEQKRQYSGITNGKNSVQLGELIGAQAFITGKVHSKSYHDRTYYENRTECVDKKCKEIRKYRVRCRERTIHLGANIKITNVENSKIIHTNTYNESGSWSSCTDDSYTVIPNPSQIWNRQANNIANQFVREITPNYSYREVELLDEPDIKYSKSQKELLSSGLAFIENNNLKKAEDFLKQLVFETHSRSYVANYNLGVIKEANGDYNKAKQLFTLAENLLKKPNDTVSGALNRINYVISKNKTAQQQLQE